MDARLKLTDAERAALELVERATRIADVIVQQPAGDYQPGQFG